jgi:sulfur-carrier protein adenylyltransferase/sulfurtransferase
MLSKEQQARYSKQIILPEIGSEGQQKITAGKVLVIGAGGLGCPILQYLAAAGVGTLGIADGDKVEISNLQRQVLYTQADIGKGKAATAAAKIAAINPHVKITVHETFIDTGNALEMLRDYDIIVDGSDNFATRYLVNDACVMLNKPMVSGAIYKFEGQVSVFNYNNGPTYRCIFPEPPEAGASPNCADIGVIATLPGIVGTLQANEVLKIITGIGTVLSGILLVLDTLHMSFHSFKFSLNEANKKITTLFSSPQLCGTVKSIDFNGLEMLMRKNEKVQLVDVREQEEHEVENIGGVNIPLSIFASAFTVLDTARPVVLYCGSGVRSANAARQLLEKGFTDVTSLAGGMNSVIR